MKTLQLSERDFEALQCALVDARDYVAQLRDSKGTGLYQRQTYEHDVQEFQRLSNLVGRVYYGIFTDRESVESNFEVKLTDDIEILYAWYEYEDYSGSAYVIFRQGGKLFETSGGHCSCYGLEGQWEPVSEVTAQTLRMQQFSDVDEDEAKAALIALIARLEAEACPTLK